MKKLWCISLALLLFFALAACGNSNDAEKTMPNNETSSPVGETQEPTPSETPDAPVISTGEFSYEETQFVFDMTEDDVVALYGEPTEREDYLLFESENASQFSYGDTVFQIAYQDNADGTKSYVFEATIADDKLVAPRNVKIGDSMEDVIAKFPANNNPERFDMDDDSGHTYQLLYGEFVYMSPCGLVEYDGDTPVAVSYYSEGVRLSYNITDGKVNSVRYTVPMT